MAKHNQLLIRDDGVLYHSNPQIATNPRFRIYRPDDVKESVQNIMDVQDPEPAQDILDSFDKQELIDFVKETGLDYVVPPNIKEDTLRTRIRDAMTKAHA